MCIRDSDGIAGGAAGPQADEAVIGMDVGVEDGHGEKRFDGHGREPGGKTEFDDVGIDALEMGGRAGESGGAAQGQAEEVGCGIARAREVV